MLDTLMAWWWDFWKPQWSTCKDFLTYIRWRDLWSALYSIIFVITASLLFGRIPKMPVAFLVCLPFIYLSVLGAGLLFLAALRDRYIGEPRHDVVRRFFGPESTLAGYLRNDGSRLLRSAFATGYYLFFGLLYLALGPEQNSLGWLLMPCLFIGMVAIFSLNQRALDTHHDLEGTSDAPVLEAAAEAGENAPPRRSFKVVLLRRSVYMCLLALSLYIMLHNLVLPLRRALLG
ncbi:MAG: hypothetical protein FWG17_07385 [Desulfovibrionaceae bacterium]|nr:hypothetical protein [Desulfovibrionaceae bacterium]